MNQRTLNDEQLHWLKYLKDVVGKAEMYGNERLRLSFTTPTTKVIAEVLDYIPYKVVIGDYSDHFVTSVDIFLKE